MAKTTQAPGKAKSIGYELFIGALSILSIVNLIMMMVIRDNESLNTVLLAVNSIMFPIFLGDFLYRFFTAEDRAVYFFRRFGWADLLSSLPLQQLKVLRIFRIWRVIRLFREFGARNLVHEFVTHRAENALLTVGFLVLCVLEFGSLLVLVAEDGAPNANITNASDAIWWAYVTITTVGYGDKYPTTNWGRIVGILVMTAGVGLFGTLSGFLANQFLTPPKEKEAETVDTASPKARLAALKRMVEAQEASTAALKEQIDEIGKLL